ncbi:hypothetical protein GCM10022392_03960 [Mucilaginibacter panaciglaebae]|uniref:Uncharacterized protein n=1 Tax=Mucilaginibacter panaciglaebae TaxID=502331 RepID=A0ABP7WDG4_9SPHI
MSRRALALLLPCRQLKIEQTGRYTVSEYLRRMNKCYVKVLDASNKVYMAKLADTQ